MEKNAVALRERDPEHAAHITGEWLAERVIGRDREGHCYVPAIRNGPPAPTARPTVPSCSTIATRPRPAARPAVTYAAPSRAMRCRPMRRTSRLCCRRRTITASCAVAANSDQSSKTQASDDHADRGLLFMCLNTDIDRQFEFVQQTWLLNSSFATLFQEVDPLVGPAGPHDDTRRRVTPRRQCGHVRSHGRRRLFLSARPAGTAVPGIVMSALTSTEVLRPGPGGTKALLARQVMALIPFGMGLFAASSRSSALRGTYVVTLYDDVREVFGNDAAFGVVYNDKSRSLPEESRSSWVCRTRPSTTHSSMRCAAW